MSDSVKVLVAPATDNQVVTNLTTGGTSATEKLQSREFLIIAKTNPAYIRLVADSEETVDATNGFNIPVGVPIRMQAQRGVQYLAYLQETGAGALSIMWGSPE